MKKPFISYNYAVLRKIVGHSNLIAFVLAMLTLIYCVYTIQSILDTPTDEQYKAELAQKRIRTTFDKETIGHIEELHDSSSTTPPVYPTGYGNPFIE